MSLMHVLGERAKRAGGGDGPYDGETMLEKRVAALETDMREVKGTLARIEAKLDRIDARLDKFDERIRKLEIDVGRIDGRLSLLPSTFTVIMTMVALSFSILGGVLAIFRFAGGG